MPLKSKSEPVVERIERQLEADEELSEFGVLGAHLVKPHLIDDRFDVRCGLGEEGHKPLVVVEASRTCDELADAARVGAAYSRVAGHEFFTGIEIERIPVLPDCAAFGHRVKADDRPVGEVGLEAVLKVFRHAGAEGLHLLIEGRCAGSELFLGFKRGGVFLVAGRVFAALGHRKPTEGGGENVWPERGREALGKGVGILQIGCDQHEAEIGFWSHDAEEEELGAGCGTDFADEFGEGGLGRDA